MSRPFHGYQNFWPSDLDLGVWPTLKKTLTLVIASLPEEVWLSYFTCAFLIARPSMPCHDFWPSDLDLPGCPSLKNFFLDYDFWISGVTYCCYLHMVAAGELCCLSDNSGYKIENSLFYGLKCILFIRSVQCQRVSVWFWIILNFSFCSLALLFRQKFQKNY